MALGSFNTEYHLYGETEQLIDSTKKDWDNIYQIQIEQFTIDDENVDLNFQKLDDEGIITSIDTGTTFVYFPSKIMRIFEKLMNTFCQQKKENCYSNDTYKRCFDMSGKSKKEIDDLIESFPNLSFSFIGGGKLEFVPQNYFYKKTENEDLYCVGIKEMGNQILIGAIMLKNYDFFFDLEKKQILFVKSDCTQIQTNLIKNFTMKKVAKKVKSMFSVFGSYFIILLGVITIFFYGLIYMNNKRKIFVKLENSSSQDNSTII